MKKFLTLAFALALALPALAANHGSMSGSMSGDHGTMSGDHGSMSGMDMSSSAHKGMAIRSTEMEGMKLRYELIDNAKMMEGQKVAPGHDMSAMKSHHLMTIFTGHDGKPMEGAKVGYLVTGPGGAEQKAMTMFMAGGYGADVDLKAKGSYKILMKADVGGKVVKDEFTYEVK